jgi:hypothetical protein
MKNTRILLEESDKMSGHRIVKKIKIATTKAARKHEYLILACIIGVALFLRLYRLGSVPSGLDESSDSL